MGPKGPFGARSLVQWYLKRCVEKHGFPSFVLYTDKISFTRESVINSHNKHVQAVESPDTTVEKGTGTNFPSMPSLVLFMIVYRARTYMLLHVSENLCTGFLGAFALTRKASCPPVSLSVCSSARPHVLALLPLKRFPCIREFYEKSV
jgi:ribosomal protein S19